MPDTQGRGITIEGQLRLCSEFQVSLNCEGNHCLSKTATTLTKLNRSKWQNILKTYILV